MEYFLQKKIEGLQSEVDELKAIVKVLNDERNTKIIVEENKRKENNEYIHYKKLYEELPFDEKNKLMMKVFGTTSFPRCLGHMSGIKYARLRLDRRKKLIDEFKKTHS